MQQWTVSKTGIFNEFAKNKRGSILPFHDINEGSILFSCRLSVIQLINYITYAWLRSWTSWFIDVAGNESFLSLRRFHVLLAKISPRESCLNIRVYNITSPTFEMDLVKRGLHCGPEQPKILTEVLGHSLVRSLVRSNRSLVPHYSLHLHTLLRSLIRSLAHSFARSLTSLYSGP